MGCGSSKQKVCRKCRAPYYSPVGRSYSMHVHHPPQRIGDSYHLVALTSSTLGSLRLEPLVQDHLIEDIVEDALSSHGTLSSHGKIYMEKEMDKDEFAEGMVKAKTWSKMINEKIPKIIPKTPNITPPGEPETINTWEMMEGLEDNCLSKPTHQFRSFSFNVPQNSSLSSIDDEPTTTRVKEYEVASPKPLWMDSADNDSGSNSNDTSILTEFDPDVIASFRKSLEDLPPANPFCLKPLGGEIVEKNKITPRVADKLIVYFTSLRGVRKTYEDCCLVRVILKGLGVRVDERDVSMHSGFKDELKDLLGEGFGGGGLPKVFVGRKFIGGAEEIRRLNDEGELAKLVENCNLVDDGGGGGNGNVCEACGDARFVPCETCSGSCKIYYDREYEDDEEESDESDNEYGFHRCPDCNENGLIRCPICCD